MSAESDAIHSAFDKKKDRERRERIATAVLAGIAANPDEHIVAHSCIHAARLAVSYADALIAELDKPERVKA